MNIWQDGLMQDSETHSPADGEPADAGIRTISSVETLKALADPTRLALLTALMRRDLHRELPVMSVKELAAALKEPQTKLYRHIKQLEEAGLVRAVSSRVVSGIVEQRYQACQRDFQVGPDLTSSERSSATLEATVDAVLDLYNKEFFAAQRAGRLPPGSGFLTFSQVRMPATLAASFKERMHAIYEEIEQANEQEDGDSEMVPVNVLMGYFSPMGDNH